MKFRKPFRPKTRKITPAIYRAIAEIGRTVLIMDTRKSGEAEKLSESLGYVRFGEVPNYARSSDGQLHTTVFFYRQLDLT